MKRLVLLTVTATLLFTTSCYVNRTTVGNGPVGKLDSKELYGKTKQGYLFWGILGLGQSQPPTPTTDFQVKSSTNVWDAVIFGLTGGIVSTRTVKIYTKK